MNATNTYGSVARTFHWTIAGLLLVQIPLAFYMVDQPLGADARHFYDTLVKRLSQDTKQVEHSQDFWGDPLTAGGPSDQNTRRSKARNGSVMAWPLSDEANHKSSLISG